jgi:hypothetical protein
MAGNEEVKEKAERNVPATVIMTPYADQDTILRDCVS